MSGLFSGRSGGGLAGGLSGGVKMAAIALLAHQLMKHARQDGGPAATQGSASGSTGMGGLGGLLGGLLGGSAASTMGGGGLLGGLGGLLGGLRNQGMGPQVDSWVGHGENRSVSPQELERHFDPRELDQAAQQAGTDRQSLLEELSRTLPHFVDRATPQGNVPQHEEEIGGGGIGGLLSGLLGGGQASGAGDDSTTRRR
ncbi:YidB family protein [Roseomonas sp. E05]|uniref:YidB family protein n=1 Tax=Roseomonas sp. E05 TaxID=3046310 RepID=UPI0024B9AD33|nr:YidB family protein [Roseomonas sp. E05]MDJ0387032.1 YidB family protein [Roseomonas sp. E05]